MMYAESRATCEPAIHRFVQAYEAKYPKAVKSLVTDASPALDPLRVPGRPRTAGLTMAFKLLQAAQRT